MQVPINLFNHASDTVRYAAGQTIFLEHQVGREMYVVLSGEVEILVRRVVVETVSAGGVIGELALIDTEPRSATARAQTECELAPVNERRFAFLVEQTPHFALQLMRIMAYRLRHMDTLIAPSA